MEKVMWRVKKNVGPHTHGKVRYASGQTFEGPITLGDSFPDKLEPVNADAAKIIEESKEGAPMAGLTVKHKGGGKYDVINKASGKAINDKLLTRDEAYKLVASTDPGEETEEDETEETEETEESEESEED